MDVSPFPKLQSPPIHEAVLDIRVRARDGVQPSEFDALRKEFEERFPKVDIMRSLEATFELSAHGSATTRTSEPNQVGLLFLSIDGKFILQTRIDGMTLSRLRPYTGFDDFFSVFANCWDTYLKVLRPVDATRLGMRYINRFDVPPAGNLQTLLTKVPISPVDDVSFTAFFHRDHYRFFDQRFSANLLTALEPSIDGSSSTIMIDVDVFREDVRDLQERILSQAFSELRAIKNRIFFSVLTQPALERFA